MDDELEHIDAAVFTGDWLEAPEEREKFREYLERWTRQLNTFETTAASDDANKAANPVIASWSIRGYTYDLHKPNGQ